MKFSSPVAILALLFVGAQAAGTFTERQLKSDSGDDLGKRFAISVWLAPHTHLQDCWSDGLVPAHPWLLIDRLFCNLFSPRLLNCVFICQCYYYY